MTIKTDMEQFEELGAEAAWYLRYGLAAFLLWVTYLIVIYAEPTKTIVIFIKYFWIVILSVYAIFLMHEVSKVVFWIAGICVFFGVVSLIPPVAIAILIGAWMISIAINKG